MAGEKTEKATPKRRQDERKKGNVPQSKDIVNLISVLVVFSAIKLLFPYCRNKMNQIIRKRDVTQKHADRKHNKQHSAYKGKIRRNI